MMTAPTAKGKDMVNNGWYLVDETLRHSSIATFHRVAATDFDYDGIAFRKGELLVFATPLASRDPAVFDDPMVFDPDRVSANRHMAFGRGEHICLGQFLAKAQLVEGVNLIAQRIKEPRFAGEIAWRPFLRVWGLETLPIAFETREPGMVD